MKRRKPMRAGLTAFILTIATSATGGIEHTVLHGVSVAGVRVWTGPGSVPGLTKEQLQSAAETSLREAGIRLTPGAPAELQIIATVMVSDSACFATLDAKLVEEARLERNGLRVEATSWGRGGVVSVNVESCAEQVTDATKSAVADFVEMYRAMNSPPSTSR
jgi:hypothetical protein